MDSIEYRCGIVMGRFILAGWRVPDRSVGHRLLRIEMRIDIRCSVSFAIAMPSGTWEIEWDNDNNKNS